MTTAAANARCAFADRLRSVGCLRWRAAPTQRPFAPAGDSVRPLGSPRPPPGCGGRRSDRAPRPGTRQGRQTAGGAIALGRGGRVGPRWRWGGPARRWMGSTGRIAGGNRRRSPARSRIPRARRSVTRKRRDLVKTTRTRVRPRGGHCDRGSADLDVAPLLADDEAKRAAGRPARVSPAMSQRKQLTVTTFTPEDKAATSRALFAHWLAQRPATRRLRPIRRSATRFRDDALVTDIWEACPSCWPCPRAPAGAGAAAR